MKVSSVVRRLTGMLTVLAVLLTGTLVPSASAAASLPHASRQTATPAPAIRPSGTLTASRASAITGEKVVLKGALPKPARRKVVLQRKQGSTWVKAAAGRTSTRKKFSFTVSAAATTTSYRAKAPAARRSKAARTPVRTVTAQSQGASLVLPSVAAAYDVVTAAATFTPARTGRAVQLQRQSGSSWVVEDTSTQAGDGTAELWVDTSAAGARTYRVVTLAADGAAAATSPARTLTVTAEPTLPPPPPPAVDTTPPAPVTDLRVTGTTTSSVSLTWTNPADTDLDGVVIRRAIGAAPPSSPTAGTFVEDTLGSSLTDTGLESATQYSYAAFAYDEVLNYSAAATISVTTTSTDPTPPGPVTGLSVTAKTSVTVSLSWANPSDSDLTGVMIRRAAGGTAPTSPTSGTLVADKAGTTHTDTGLAPNTQYSYAVFAHDAMPNYASGATVTVTTDPPDSTPPGPVTNVVAAPSATTVTLGWSNPSTADLVAVTIRRALGATAPATPTSGTAVAEVAAPGAGHTDTGLSPSTQYSYALFAHDAVPNHAAAATITVTTEAASLSDWAQTGRDAGHTGWAPDEVVLTPANAGSVAEEFTIPGDGSPAVAGGLLYTTGTSDLGPTTLGAYDLTTAAPSWQITTSGACTGPVAVTAALVIVNCAGAPRAYDRGGSHAVAWDVATTDPGQQVQRHLVLGNTLVAWTNTKVAAYRLSDGQRLWQQLLPSGSGSIYDVAAAAGSVVVAYDDRLRALSLTTGVQQWSRAGVAGSSVVIAGSWVYVDDHGAARQVALATGLDGWTAAVPSIYRVVAADGDSVYVWEAVFDFASPYPSRLHALRVADGSERWQYDVPSRLGSVAVAGNLVWLTSTGIYSQEHASALIGVRRSDGTEVAHLSFDDNTYDWTDVAFGAGKVVIDQGGSFGGPPRQLRVFGLGGAVPIINERLVPLSYVGTAYSRQLTARGPAPFSWSLVSGTLPAGVSFSAGGRLSGTPASASTNRFQVQVTSANGRTSRRQLTLQAVQASTPGWGTVGRDATGNPFETAVPSLDVDTAPTLGFRWKTSAPAPANYSYNDPVTVGDRLYVVGVDGALHAWDTTGGATNRAALWSATPAGAGGSLNAFTSSPVVDGTRLLVLDQQGHLSSVRTSDGVTGWRTADPVPAGGSSRITVVGTTVLVLTSTGGVKAFSATTGAPLWGGAETAADTDFWMTSLSSNGTLAYALTGCELFAIRVSDGTVAWRTRVPGDPATPCDYYLGLAPAPAVVDGVVYASTPWGMLSVDAVTGTPILRMSGGAQGAHAVVGGAWIFLRDERLVAVDATSGDLLWRTSDVTSMSGLAVSRDLVLAQTPYGQLIGLDRVTGEKVWEGSIGNSYASTAPAIGTARIFAQGSDGVYSFGPL